MVIKWLSLLDQSKSIFKFIMSVDFMFQWISNIHIIDGNNERISWDRIY